MTNVRLIFAFIGIVWGVCLLYSCKGGKTSSMSTNADSTATSGATRVAGPLDLQTSFWVGKVGEHTLKLYLRANDTLLAGQAYSVSQGYNPMFVRGAIRNDAFVFTLSEPFFEDTPNGRMSNEHIHGELNLTLEGQQLVGKWKSSSTKDAVSVSLNKSELGYGISHFVRQFAIEKDNVALAYIIPRLEMKANSAAEKAFISTITTHYEHDFQSKKDSVQSWLKSQAQLMKDNPGLPQSGYGENSDYTVMLATPSILSIQQQGYYYTGGAHGMPWISAHTFDIRSGKQVELATLFNNGFNYRSFIWNYCRKELQQNYGLLQPGDELDKQLEAFDCFYFTANALVIQFQAYEVGPYVVGMPSVNIPFSALKPHLNPSNDIIGVIERER